MGCEEGAERGCSDKVEAEWLHDCGLYYYLVFLLDLTDGVQIREVGEKLDLILIFRSRVGAEGSQRRKEHSEGGFQRVVQMNVLKGATRWQRVSR